MEKVSISTWIKNDPLLFAILGTAIGLAVLVVGIAVFWGSGPVIAEIPWYIPMVATFVSLTNLSVAYLALGRYQALHDPVSFWVGTGFASLGIGHLFIVLAWPGLLPDGGAIIARLPNTSAFITALNLTIFGGFLLAAVLVRWPGKQTRVGRRWLGAVAAWLFFVTLTFILLVSLEQYLPMLVRTDGTFTSEQRVWVAFLLLLFAAGSSFSTRYYLRSRNALAGYVAFSQMAVVFILLMTILGEKRYDLWWYMQRVVAVCGYLIVLFGLLFEYVRLFRRERESEARYQQLTESLPQLIWTCTADGLCDYLSPQWVAYTGIPVEPQLGQGWFEQLHPEDRQLAIERWRVSTTIAVKYDTEFRIRRQDGEYRWYKVLAVPIRDLEGQVNRWFGSFTDIEELKRAEQALQKTLAQAEAGRLMLDTILENIPIGLTITGGPPDFPLARVSRHGLEMNQRPAEELIGLPSGQHQAAWRIFLPDGVTQPLPEQMPLYRASRFGEQTRNLELLMKAQDGREIPLLAVAAPVRDAQGQIVAAINAWLDITEIKQAEDLLKERNAALRESEARYRRLIENANEGIWTIDTDHRTDFINPRGAEILGYTVDEMIGRPPLDLVFPEDFAHASQQLADRQQGINAVHDMRMRHKDGHAIWVSSSSTSILGEKGEYLGALAMFVDITERKRAEEALAESAKKLEHSNRELEQFAFVASHDLKEPLRKIEAFGDSLLKNTTQLDDRGRNYVERMRVAAGRMRDMVDGLLQLSRVTTQGRPFVPVDLSQIAAGVLSDLDHQVRCSGGNVEIDELPVVEGDPLQLRQLLQNLLGNALKFHRPGTPPCVKIYSNQLPASVQILVEDNGIGFNLEEVERMFQPFQRMVGRDEYEGGGMGLAICSRIVERHGGEITAKGNLGIGSSFIVTLPIHEG